MSRALIAVTSHADFGALERKTGYWLGEVTHFWHVMAEAGIDVDFVSPKGGKPPLDEKSVASRDRINQQFTDDPVQAARLESTLKPSEVRADDYDVVYYAGGHGAMWDFPGNAPLAEIAARIHARGGVVSAVCHGSAGLLEIKRADGRRLIDGQLVTGFANLEERLVGLTRDVPFLLQDELKKRGGVYKSALIPFTPYVATGDRLVTGQNPQSARATAKAVLDVLKRCPPK
jgi:putative intracellular protease/amidase